jgi:hypothetical protein
MDDEREFSPWRLCLSAGLMIGFAALGLSLLFGASDRSTVASVRSATQVIRPVEATPATSVVAKPIEQVQAGERVLSRDEHTGELVLRPVAQAFVRTSDHLRLLTLRTSAGVDEQIETTDEHPFWVEGTGWTAAKSLQAGQRLTEPDGSITTILASARVEQPDGVTVYNFEVEDTHSYFVAARGSRGPPVWVHNADGYDDAIGGAAPTRIDPEILVRHRAGNTQVRHNGARWNVPTRDTSRVPLTDPLGDHIQQLADQHASRFHFVPTARQQETLLRLERAGINTYGIRARWAGQAKGREVDRMVKADLAASHPDLRLAQPFEGGIDIFNPSTGIGYDIMFGSKSNIHRHAMRENIRTTLFRYIEF